MVCNGFGCHKNIVWPESVLWGLRGWPRGNLIDGLMAQETVQGLLAVLPNDEDVIDEAQSK